MAAQDDSRVDHLSFYDHYGFAVYSPGSERAEEDCRNHEYKYVSDKLTKPLKLKLVYVYRQFVLAMDNYLLKLC